MKAYQADAAIHEAEAFIRQLLRLGTNVTREDLWHLLDILGAQPEPDEDGR